MSQINSNLGILNQLEIDKFYLREAYRFASKYSDDPITQNGAIIVADNTKASLENILAYGTNHFPKNIKKTQERLNDRIIKLFYIEHAERDVIFNAIENKIDLTGKIMYCPWFACSGCARAIIRFNFKEIIGHSEPDKFYEEVNREKIEKGEKKSSWKDDIEAGFNILNECGVSYRFVDGKIGGVKIIFARREFEP